jgi:hypothetical protein
LLDEQAFTGHEPKIAASAAPRDVHPGCAESSRAISGHGALAQRIDLDGGLIWRSWHDVK